MTEPRTYVVYMHTNVLTGKSYVGITYQGLRRRWKQHVAQATCIAKRNTVRFHNAIAKHGPDCWLHSVLETCAGLDAANEAEKKWVAELQTHTTGYNSTLGGDGVAGHVASEETKAKLREAHKRRGPVSKETRAKLSESNKGKHRITPEVRRKLVEGQRLHPHKPTEETRRKISIASSSRKASPETRARLSVAKMGHPAWPAKTEVARANQGANIKRWLASHSKEERAAIARAFNTGRKHTGSARKNMSEAGKRRVQRDGLHRDQLEKVWAANRGRKMDPEVVAKRAAKHKGFHLTEEAKRKMSDSRRGIPRSPEATAKAAASNRGKKRSPEFCKLMSEKARQHAPISEETRQKMRDGQQRRFAKEGANK